MTPALYLRVQRNGNELLFGPYRAGKINHKNCEVVLERLIDGNRLVKDPEACRGSDIEVLIFNRQIRVVSNTRTMLCDDVEIVADFVEIQHVNWELPEED